ncbi:MAG: non-ribosomal peptide synthetase [Verrucomicrobia bacterium]|nr:non-ribosomal peptide synthetase [Verrucomicrobiota bacterium]MDA1066227.1 non-ribosomal peptide synthetase [Verrucomicrobiota bacterium]
MISFEPISVAETAQSIPKRIEEQVRKHGKHLAVKTQSCGLTYNSLNLYANRIASDLLSKKVPAKSPIVILCEQGAPFIAATLGVLKAGMFYVPLEPSDRPSYLLEILQCLDASTILTDNKSSFRLNNLVQSGQRIINIEEFESGPPIENPSLQIDPDSLAYIYFTSGSTGRPKGVTDTHRNVLHNILRYTNSLKITWKDKLTLLHSPSLSACVSSQYGALLNGASVFPNRTDRDSIDTLASWLIEEEITIYHSIPLVFRFALNEFSVKSSLRMIRLEGDEAAVEDLQLFSKFCPPKCILVNGLGSTETGLCRQFFFEKDGELPTTTVPIGYPVEDMEIFVIGEDGNPVVTNQLGEIVVRSRFLSPGYWNDTERTIKSFLEDTRNPGFRIFKTGDLGRFKEDGCLEYLGRVKSGPEFQEQVSRNGSFKDSSTEQHTTPNQEIQNTDPSSPTEIILATIWVNILNCESISTNDDFLLLNGDSIKAMRMVNQINLELGIQISIKDLFLHNVFSDLVKFVESRTESSPK